jgi:copper(I)-binding protein
VNRALRAATMGALLLSPIALTACSAGQVSQTATQNRDKVGPEAQARDITLRQVLLEYPTDGRYSAGDEAPLSMSIINSSNQADVLVGIEGDAFNGVVVSGQATPSPAVPGSPSAAPSTEAPPSAPGEPTSAPAAPAAPTSLPGAPTSAPEAPSPPAGPTTATGSTRVDIPVPARSTVQVGDGSTLTVDLADLSEDLTTGQSVALTLTFQRAGEITIDASVANPDRALPRGQGFDFHEGAAEGRESEQDTESK